MNIKIIFVIVSGMFLVGCSNSNSENNPIIPTYTQSQQNPLLETGTLNETETSEMEMGQDQGLYSNTDVVNDYPVIESCFQEQGELTSDIDYGKIILWNPEKYSLLNISDRSIEDISVVINGSPDPFEDFVLVSPDSKKIFYSFRRNDQIVDYRIMNLETGEEDTVPWLESYDSVGWLNSDAMLFRDFESDVGNIFQIKSQSIIEISLVHPNQS